MYHVKQIAQTQPCKFRLSTSEEYGFLLTTRGTSHIRGMWDIRADDLLICKPHQTIELEYSDGRIPLTAIWVCISTSRMNMCSGSDTDILTSFQINPMPIVRVLSRNPYLMLVKSLAIQLQSLPGDSLHLATDLLEQSTIQMFLALVLNICFLEDPHRTNRDTKTENRLSLDEVFSYIHTHITEDLSLDKLEQVFYVSRHHLIREFKKQTGQTIHQYIIKSRLELSRRYIEQGYSINEVYRMGGFNGYNHFFKVFKKTYGITPKEYYLSVHPNPKGKTDYPEWDKKHQF